MTVGQAIAELRQTALRPLSPADFCEAIRPTLDRLERASGRSCVLWAIRAAINPDPAPGRRVWSPTEGC